MSVVRVKGIQRFFRKGKWYIYHRRSGKPIKAEFGTPAFFAELAALDAAMTPTERRPGSLGMVIEAYRASQFWRDLRPATRLSYDRALAVLEPLDKMPLIEITPGFVSALRDRVAEARGRWMANYCITLISILADFARERDWMRENPAKNIRKIGRDKSKPKQNRAWTPVECRAVLDAAPAYLKVPIGLAMFAGLRKRDALTARKGAIKDGRLIHVTSKRDVPIAVPVPAQLAEILAAAPANAAETIAATMRGAPWTESGFNVMFSRLIRGLEATGSVAPGLTMHGLRRTYLTRVRETGADLDTARRLGGHKTLGQTVDYTDSADDEKAARRAVSRLKIV